MNYIFLKEQIENGISTRGIAKMSGKSQTTVRYWLKKYDIKNEKKEFFETNFKICHSCKEKKLKSEFYSRSDRREGCQPYCKKCSNKFFIERWIERKIWAIEYKGGKCVDCEASYPSFPYVIFDFHHLDPSKKDMNWSKIRLTSIQKMKDELDKCVLLCSNCHRVRHHEILKVVPTGFEPV